MLACSTGLADCVKLLAMKNADFTKFDDNGRGCLQLAWNSQGPQRRLARWLEKTVPDIPSSCGRSHRPKSGLAWLKSKKSAGVCSRNLSETVPGSIARAATGVDRPNAMVATGRDGPEAMSYGAAHRLCHK